MMHLKVQLQQQYSNQIRLRIDNIGIPVMSFFSDISIAFKRILKVASFDFT